MRYSWDGEKNRRNIALHGIAFEDAKRIFEGPTVERVDDRFDYGEIRVYAVGLVDGLEITLVYTDRDNGERRIISAWRAEPPQKRPPSGKDERQNRTGDRAETAPAAERRRNTARPRI